MLHAARCSLAVKHSLSLSPNVQLVRGYGWCKTSALKSAQRWSGVKRNPHKLECLRVFFFTALWACIYCVCVTKRLTRRQPSTPNGDIFHDPWWAALVNSALMANSKVPTDEVNYCIWWVIYNNCKCNIWMALGSTPCNLQS